jgi:hypothetical protein
MTNLRKALVFSLGVITVFSMSMIAVPFQADAAASAGDLIKIDGYSPVYYLGADNKRYVFPNESTYFSWYGDFSSVKTLGQTEVESYPLAANVVVRAGTKLVKRPVPTDPKVYAVEPGGILRHIPTEAVAVSLYGNNWAKRVVDVPDSFFVNYIVSNDAVEEGVYPAGSLVKYSGSADVYYINEDGEAQKIASESAFLANRFKWDDVLTAPSTATMPATGDAIDGKEDMADTSQGGNSGTGPVVDPNKGSGLSVALSSDTPDSQNIPMNISVEMLRFDLTAANDGDVSVSTLTISAGGLGDSEDIDDVSIYVDGTKYGSTKDVSGSTDSATFNFSTPLVVEAGDTKEVVVKAKLADDETYKLVIKEAEDIVTDGADVSGSFPISGSLMSGVDATVGVLTFDADDNDDTAQVGEDDISAVTFTAEATEEDVLFSGLTLKNEGTLDAEDTGEFVLVMNDEEIATAEMVGDYVSFTFDDVLMEENSPEDFEVIFDLEGGSANETLQLVIDDDADVNGIGEKGYPVSVVRTAFAEADADSTTITVEAGDLTINFDEATVPAKDILKDMDNVVLGRLEITANAEAVNITNIQFDIQGTNVDNNDIENVEMIGVESTVGSYDLTTTFNAGNWYDAVIEDEIYIEKGETATFDIRVDVTTNAETNDQFEVELLASDIEAEGIDSEETITDITPSSATGAYMTVVASGLSHATLSLGAVTAVAGNDDGTKIYKGRLTASTASGVKVGRMIFKDNDTDEGSDFNDSDVNEVILEVYDEGNTLVSEETETNIAENGASANTVTFDDDFVVPAGEYVTVYLLATFSSSATADDAFTIALDSVSAKNDGSVNNNDDNVTVTPSAVTGPTVTLAESGHIDVTMSITEANANRDMYVTAGETSGLMSTLKFDAQDEAIKIEDIYLMATEDAESIFDDVTSVQLVDSDGTTVLDETTSFAVGDYDGAADDDDVIFKFEDWNYTIAEAGVKNVYVRVKTTEIGTGEQVGTSGTSIEFSIYSVKAVGSNGTITLSGAAAPSSADTNNNFENDAVSNAVINAGVNVTAILNGMTSADTDLTGGENIIGKFKFAVDGGNNTDADGNAAELDLQFIDLTIGADTTTIGGVQIYWESDSSVKVEVLPAVINAAGTYTIDVSALEGITSQDTLIVKAMDVTGYVDTYIQTKLQNIDTTILWSDATGLNTLTGVYLPYDEVVCTSVSNN